MKFFLLLPALLMIAASQGFAANPVLKFTLTKADGVPATYEFLTPGEGTSEGATISGADSAAQQHNAGVAALAWAKQFYGAHDIYLRSVELKQTGPVPYYLATFDGELAGARQVFFAVVLESGSVVEPVEMPWLRARPRSPRVQGSGFDVQGWVGDLRGLHRRKS